MALLLQDAWDIAQKYLDDSIRPNQPVEVLIASVLDHEKAWSFAYNSRGFLSGEDFLSSLVGNGPIVVPKDGSAPFLASSAEPVPTQLDRL